MDFLVENLSSITWQQVVMWVIGGLLMLFGVFFGGMVPFIVFTALMVIVPVVYSYVYYVRHK